MKCYIVLLSLSILVAAQLELATDCDEEVCQLPACRCSSTNIPGGLLPRDTPQLVIITFDDGVNVGNIETYRSILYNRRNSNGCPIGATFYVNHEYNNYQLVNELYNQGYEIGLRSISQRIPQGFWADASYNDLKEEVADQRDQMAHFANIPKDSIKGVRLPFLQLAGNTSFQVMKDYGLQYDSSWPTTSFTNPGLWPYTLDFASIQDCPTAPCPSASIPGVWVQPMVTWRDLPGNPCSTVDSCIFVPPGGDADGWYQFLVENFERHYLNNRAPFGFYIRASHFDPSGRREAYIRFLNLLNNLHDVFMVNSAEVIEWVQNPVPIDEYRNKACKTINPVQCEPRTCPLIGQHNNMEYWMASCVGVACPRVYPWVGNPLGV